MIKRCESCGQALPEFGGIVADADRGEVRYLGYAAYLTKQEFDLFRFLLDKKGSTATKEAIFDHLYQLGNEDVEIKIIDVFVCKLRKKIGRIGLRIGTAWARGYFLEAPVVAAT